jgi:hypothetical protein
LSLSDIFKVVENGGPDVIFLLLVFSSLWLLGRIFSKESIAYRDEQVRYRDALIERQGLTITHQQELFDQALRLIKEDLLPMIERQQKPRIGT